MLRNRTPSALVLSTLALAILAFGHAGPAIAWWDGATESTDVDVRDAAARSSLIQPGNKIPSAVSVYVTPRGQNYFRNNLDDVLSSQGFEFGSAQFASFNYKAEKPLSLDDLTPRTKGQKSTVVEIRDLLKSWLLGFQFNDPLITASATNLAYDLKMKRLGIRASNPVRMASGGTGVVLTLEAEIPELRVDIAKIRAADLNNDFLNRKYDGGKAAVGVNNFWTRIKANSENLKISVPFLVETDRSGKLSVRAMQFRTNFPSVNLEMGLDTPLFLPEVEIRINDRKMTLDPKALERDLLAKQDKLLKLLQSYLTDTAEEQVIVKLNALLADVLEGGPLNEINQMDPVAIPENVKIKDKDKLRWAISPSDVNFEGGQIRMDLAAYFEDPLAKSPSTLPISAHAPAHAKPVGFPADAYDMAIGINQGTVNRLLQLSFERGYFRNHELLSFDPSPAGKCKIRGRSNIRLTARPEIRFTSPTRNEGEMAVRFFRPSNGFQESIGLKGGLNVALKVKLKIEMDAKTGPRIRMTEVDPASVKFDPKDIRFSALASKVDAAVKDAVKIANEEFVGCPAESVIAGQLPLPDSVVGIPFKIKDLQSDSNGNLIMYVEYGVKKNG